jgi:lysophospholipase L1-like esterase
VHRRLLLLVVCLLAVALLGLVDWLDDRDPGAGIDLSEADVVVIGDSVTDQSKDQIVAAMPGQDVSVIGLSGLRTDELLPVIVDVLGGDDRPAVGVVMAGYNDLWQGRDQESPVEAALEATAGVDCAVWVLVPTTGPWELDRARAFDQRVRDAAEDAGVTVVAEWQGAVDDPDSGSELVTPDGVHPSDAGKERVAEVMARAVDEICG